MHGHEIRKNKNKIEMHGIVRWENPVDDDTLTVKIYRALSSWPIGYFGSTTYLVTDLRGKYKP